MKVLLVDDEPDFLEQAKVFLEREEEELDIDTAPSAEEGLELLENNAYDGIVSDYQMPGMDGLEFLEVIREDRNSDIPFIIFTGKGREEVAIEALNLGADRYLEKGGSPKSQYGVLAQAIVQEVERSKAEERLEKAKDRAKKYLNIADVIIVAQDRNQEVIEINERGCEVLGYDKNEIIGKNWSENFMPERVRKDVLKDATKPLMNGRVEEGKRYENPIVTKDGEERIISWKNSVIRNDDGEAIGILSSGRDITERKEAEEEIQKRESELEERVKELNCLYGISELAEEYGNSLEDVLQGSVELIPPSWQYPEITCARLVVDDEEFRTDNYSESEWKMESDILVGGEKRGSLEVIYLEKRPELDEGPFLKEERDLIEGITERLGSVIERLEAEEELVESEKRLNLALEGTKAGLWDWNVQTGETTFDERWAEIVGYELEELEPVSIETWRELAHPEDLERSDELLEKHFDGETDYYEFEGRMKHKDGHWIWIQDRGRVVEWDDEGNPVRMTGTHVDITDQKREEEHLKQYKMAVEGSENLMAACDEDYRYTFANDAYLEYHGQDRGELEGKKLKDVLGVEAFEQEVKPHVDRCLEGERIQYEMERTHPELGERILDVSYYPLRREREIHGVVAVMRDITERKEAKEELEQYRTAVVASDDSVYMIDRNYRYVFANDEHVSRLASDGKIPQKSKGEVVGRKYGDIHPPRDLETLKRNIEKILKTGGPRTERYEFLTEDRWSSRTYSPVRDPETGRVKGVVVVSKNITERVKAENREELLHSLLRHDVRNKAQIAQGCHELLRDFELTEEAKRYVEKASDAVQGSVELIEKVRTLRKLEREEEIGEVSVGKAIKNVISESEPQAEEKGIDIEREETDYNAQGGPLLEDLFSNLLENSILHSGCENIRISGRETKEECIVTIADDGRGIPDEDKGKIFDRGYKKGETGGSGLGLYLVKEIAENYGGSIEVEDSELGGARFDVYLQKA